MKTLNKSAIVAAFSLLLGARAYGATLYTPPALASSASDMFYCKATNVRSKPVSVTIEMHSYSGAVTDTMTYTVTPGWTAGFGINGGTRAYCKFIVAGPKSSVRASAQYAEFGANTYSMAIPAK